jgi:hypothetical protein
MTEEGIVTTRLTTAGAIIATALVALLPAAGTAQTNADKLHVEAFAVNLSNVGTGSNQIAMIDINSWSTQDERQSLITTMLEKGQNDLLKALQKARVKGRLWFPQVQGPDPLHARLGFDLHYAWQVPLPEGGKRIVIATDRPISFWEARNQPRSIDYPFTLIQIQLDKDGKGEGKLSVATKINFDKKTNTIELENYASEAVRLQNVKAEIKK